MMLWGPLLCCDISLTSNITFKKTCVENLCKNFHRLLFWFHNREDNKVAGKVRIPRKMTKNFYTIVGHNLAMLSHSYSVYLVCTWYL